MSRGFKNIELFNLLQTVEGVASVRYILSEIKPNCVFLFFNKPLVIKTKDNSSLLFTKSNGSITINPFWVTLSNGEHVFDKVSTDEFYRRLKELPRLYKVKQRNDKIKAILYK